jgi:Na+/H+ antiporter NhaD/arsenite permease-like protein
VASPLATSWIAAIAVAVASNIINNLPVGLIAAATNRAAEIPAHAAAAILIGIDVGPNLSVTGSLATILWLIALRREGENVTSLRFLKFGRHRHAARTSAVATCLVRNVPVKQTIAPGLASRKSDWFNRDSC